MSKRKPKTAGTGENICAQRGCRYDEPLNPSDGVYLCPVCQNPVTIPDTGTDKDDITGDEKDNENKELDSPDDPNDNEEDKGS